MITAVLTLLAGGSRMEVAVAVQGALTAALVADAERHFEGLQREAVRAAWGFDVDVDVDAGCPLPPHYRVRITHGRWRASFDVPEGRGAWRSTSRPGPGARSACRSPWRSLRAETRARRC